MARSACTFLLALLLAALVLLAPAALAQDRAGFGANQTILAPGTTQLAAAVGGEGRAVVAGVQRVGERVVVATRDRSGAPWRAVVMGGRASESRDVQAAVGRNGLVVVAWSHVTRSAQELRVATALPGREPRTVQRLRLGNGWSASPRLTTTASGIVLLAYRDAPRGRTSRVVVRRMRASGSGFGVYRTVGTGTAQVALTAAGEGAVVAWTRPFQRNRPRAAYSRRLTGGGAPQERPSLITRDAGSTLRLAGGPDWRSIASWVRPARDGRQATAFTRSLRPVLRPARPLGAPGLRPRASASIAAAAGGRALAALPGFGENPFGFRVLTARSLMGGVWTGARELGPPSAMGGQPRAAITPAGEELVAWTRARQQLGQPVYDVLVTAGDRTASLGTTTAGDGEGLVLAQAGARLLVAWPSTAGIELAERG